MPFVVDASVTCAWVFADEVTAATDALLEQAATDDVVVPALWQYEVQNVLVQAVRRSRITDEQASQAWSCLDALHLRQADYDAPFDDVMRLSRSHGLTAYDASYLALALYLAFPLATLDAQLTQAAAKEKVDVLGT